MAMAPDAFPLASVLVPAASAVLVLVLSKWFDAHGAKRTAAAETRRAVHADRREEDRAAKATLSYCEQENNELRDRINALRFENAMLCTVLATNKIEIPAFIQQSLP